MLTSSLGLAENNILSCQVLGNMINLSLVPGAQHWSSAILGMNLLKIFSVSWQTTTVVF